MCLSTEYNDNQLFIKCEITITFHTWPPFWQDKHRYPAFCSLGLHKRHVRCCWWAPYQSTPTLQRAAGSWCGCRSETHKDLFQCDTCAAERPRWHRWWRRYITRLFLVARSSAECVITFSPVRVTMSRGPYMKRPITIWTPSSVNTASFTRWFAVTFWKTGNQKLMFSLWFHLFSGALKCKFVHLKVLLSLGSASQASVFLTFVLFFYKTFIHDVVYRKINYQVYYQRNYRSDELFLLFSFLAK